MSVESEVYNAVKALVANRVFPDVAPEGTDRPYVTYQAVGGASINFLSQSVPGKRNTRMQVNVWADSRSVASALSTQVEDAIRMVSALQTTVMGAPISTYEPDTKLHGTQQDFSLWL